MSGLRGGPAASGRLAAEPVPVLAPSPVGDPPPVLPDVAGPRGRRWSNVLDWYGTAAAGPRAQPPPDPAAPRHPVVAVGPDWLAPARLYTDRLVRPLLVADRVADVPAAVAGAGFRSVTIAAPAEQLGWHALETLDRGLALPWGVLTAQDPAGMTFLVRKLLLGAAGHVRTGVGMVDGLGRAVDLPDTGTGGGPGPASMAAALRGSDLGCLTVFAHGEGGHVNLGGAVLCGLVGEVERDLDGTVLDGCREVAGRRVCKRAPDPETPVLSPADLRAAYLWLLSCTSASSVSPPHPYPSRNSAVLSALDGFAAGVLALRDSTAIAKEEAYLAGELFRQRYPLGEIRGVLNEIQDRRSGFRPYVLFGDPAAAGPDPGQDAGAASRSRARIVRLEPAARVATVGLDLGPVTPPDRPVTPPDRPVTPPDRPGDTGPAAPDPAGTREPAILRGTGLIAVVGDEMPPAVLDAIRDRSGIADRSRAWLGELGRRLSAAATFERAVMRRYAPVIDRDERLYGLCDELFRLRVGLEQIVQAGFDVLQRVSAAGTWDPAVGWWLSRAVEAADRWDRTAASLLVSPLLAGDVFGLLADSLPLGGRREPDRCRYCGSLVTDSTRTDPLSGRPLRRFTRCLRCGDLDSWPEEGPRIAVAGLTPARPGHRGGFDYQVAGGTALFDRPPEGWLVAQAYDKANRRLFLRLDRREEGGARRRLEVEVPADVAGDLHYLWLVWVCDLSVSVLKRRWLAVRPAGSGSTRPGHGRPDGVPA